MRRLVVLLAVLVFAGCLPPKKASQSAVSPQVTAAESVRDRWRKEQKASDNVLYQGKPPSFWVKLIHDKDDLTNQAAKEALIAIGEPALPFLAEAIVDSDRYAKILIRVCFIDIGRKSVPYLRQAIHEAKPESYKEIAFALAWLTRGDRALLPDDDYQWAEKALRESEYKEALDVLNSRR